MKSKKRRRSIRYGMVHVSQGIAPALAKIYHRLASGSKAQQQRAEDFRELILAMGEEIA